MAYKVETASDRSIIYGESPLWDNRRQQLVFNDCFGKKICIFDPNTREIVQKEVKPLNKDVLFTGVAMPYASSTKKFAVTLSTGKIVEFDWELEKVTKVLYDYTSSKLLEDGKCDAKGRFWVGTAGVEDLKTLKLVSADKGELHKLWKSEETLKSVTLIGEFGHPNGLAFNKAQNQLYWNDLSKRYIKLFEFDLEHGTLGNSKVIFDYKDHEVLNGSFPDGLASDTSGHLWVSCWKGGCVIKTDGNTGKLLDKIDIPVTNTTSVAFGGSNYSTLYVTTTAIELDQSPVMGQPEAGKLFQITNPKDNSFRGFQEHFFQF